MTDDYIVWGDEETNSAYDCFTWQARPPPGGHERYGQSKHQGAPQEPEPTQEGYPRIGPSAKAEIGKPRTRGLSYPRDKTMGMPTNVEGDRVIDALRAWPNKCSGPPGGEDETDDDQFLPASAAVSGHQGAVYANQGDRDDIRKLLSHGYAPREEPGNARNTKKGNEKSGKGKGLKKPQMNKASVLLCNTNTEKITKIEQPRWMPKYCQKVPAHLDTGLIKKKSQTSFFDRGGYPPADGEFLDGLASPEDRGPYVTSAMDVKAEDASQTGSPIPQGGSYLEGGSGQAENMFDV